MIKEIESRIQSISTIFDHFICSDTDHSDKIFWYQITYSCLRRYLTDIRGLAKTYTRVTNLPYQATVIRSLENKTPKVTDIFPNNEVGFEVVLLLEMYEINDNMLTCS